MNLVETYKDEIIGYREQRPQLSFRVIVDKLFQDHGACIRFFSYLSIIYTNQYSCTTLKNAVHIWIGDETDDTSLNTPPTQTTQPHNPLSGTKFNLSLSISICVSFLRQCLQNSVNDKKSLQPAFSQSVKVAAVPITTLFNGHWKGLFRTTNLNH